MVDRTCEWQIIEYDIWGTECGNTYEFFDGGPKENRHKYCPYCGGKIVVIESESKKSVLYPEIKQVKAKQGETTIRPEFPVVYEEG